MERGRVGGRGSLWLDVLGIRKRGGERGEEIRERDPAAKFARLGRSHARIRMAASHVSRSLRGMAASYPDSVPPASGFPGLSNPPRCPPRCGAPSRSPRASPSPQKSGQGCCLPALDGGCRPPAPAPTAARPVPPPVRGSPPGAVRRVARSHVSRSHRVIRSRGGGGARRAALPGSAERRSAAAALAAALAAATSFAMVRSASAVGRSCCARRSTRSRAPMLSAAQRRASRARRTAAAHTVCCGALTLYCHSVC